MKINLVLLRQISLFSIIIGLITGIIANIPFIGGFVFVVYFLTLSAFILVYLKKNNILGEMTIKEGAIMGAIIGLTSFGGFCVSFVPICLIKSFITNNFLGNIIANGFTNIPMLFTLAFLIILIALLCALMNGFTGGVTAYIYEVLSEYQKEKPNDFNIRMK